MDTSSGGLGLTATQVKQLKTEIEQRSDAIKTFTPLTKEWFDRGNRPQEITDVTDSTVPLVSTTLPPTQDEETMILFEISNETYTSNGCVDKTKSTRHL